MTSAQIAALEDGLLLEHLLTALTLDHQPEVDALLAEVLRRGLLEQASDLARERTAQERRRRG